VIFLQVMRLGPVRLRVDRKKLLLAFIRARAKSCVLTGISCLYANILDQVSH